MRLALHLHHHVVTSGAPRRRVTTRIRAGREEVNQRRKVRISYRDVAGRASERTVRPLALAFYGPVWLLASWCELRQDFRSFRLDRIAELAVLEEPFRLEPGKTIQDFLKRESA